MAWDEKGRNRKVDHVTRCRYLTAASRDGLQTARFERLAVPWIVEGHVAPRKARALVPYGHLSLRFGRLDEPERGLVTLCLGGNGFVNECVSTDRVSLLGNRAAVARHRRHSRRGVDLNLDAASILVRRTARKVMCASEDSRSGEQDTTRHAAAREPARPEQPMVARRGDAPD